MRRRRGAIFVLLFTIPKTPILNNNVILTEDGQRLQIEDGLIGGTDNPGPGLAQQTGNVLDEKNNDDAGGACPAPAPKTTDATSGNNRI